MGNRPDSNKFPDKQKILIHQVHSLRSNSVKRWVGTKQKEKVMHGIQSKL